MWKLYAFLAICAILVGTGEAKKVKCFDCNSADTPACGVYFTQDTRGPGINIVDCDICEARRPKGGDVYIRGCKAGGLGESEAGQDGDGPSGVGGDWGGNEEPVLNDGDSDKGGWSDNCEGDYCNWASGAGQLTVSGLMMIVLLTIRVLFN